jgi:hypothetical protein
MIAPISSYNPGVATVPPAVGRIRVLADPGSLRIDIAPPVSVGRLRRRIVAASVALGAGSVLALLRLSDAWHRTARAAPDSLGPGLLALLTLSVTVGAPMAVWGLLSLLFAEESLRIRGRDVRQEIHVFGRASARAVAAVGPGDLRWTTWPVSPWWTWTFQRLALGRRGARLGLGATLGVSEKRRLAEIVRRAIE